MKLRFILVFGFLFALGCSDELPAPAPDPSVGSTNGNDDDNNNHEGSYDGDCRRDTDCDADEICDDGQCVSDSHDNNVGNNDNGSDDGEDPYVEHNPPVEGCYDETAGVTLVYVGVRPITAQLGMTWLEGANLTQQVEFNDTGRRLNEFPQNHEVVVRVSDSRATGFWVTPNEEDWEWWNGLNEATKLRECRRLFRAESTCLGQVGIRLTKSKDGCEASWDNQ